MAHVTLLSQDSDLHSVTDVESYNHYFGWYGGKYEQNSVWFDDYHKKYPDRCIGLSEYGAEGIITYQPDEPKCRDYSEAYQAEYMNHGENVDGARLYLEQPCMNMFDFGCAARDEGGVAGRNNKGLVTIDRKIKRKHSTYTKHTGAANHCIRLRSQIRTESRGDYNGKSILRTSRQYSFM